MNPLRILLLSVLTLFAGVSTSMAADPAFYKLPVDFRDLYQGGCDWGDFDKDGDPDIVLSGFHTAYGTFTSTPETRLFRNDGNRTFTDMSLDMKGLYSGPVAFADVDSDGYLDIMITGSDKSSNFTKIYRFFTEEANRRYVEITHPFPNVSDGSISWGDFDGDSDQDLLLAGDTGSGSIVALYRSEPGATFEEPWRKDFDPIDLAGMFPSLLGPIAKWFDYDMDGRLDMIVSGERAIERTPYLGLFRNTGSGFTEVVDSGLPQVDASSITWADYDNDGEPDLLLQGTTTGGASFAKVYRNRSGEISDVEFVEYPIALFPQFSNFSTIGAWGDFNADGYRDFIAGGGLPLEPAARVFFSNISLAFTAGAGIGGISDFMSIHCAAPADFDLDGDTDLFLTGNVGQIAIASVFESYKKASAGGIVRNTASAPLAGVTVRLINSSGETITALTDANGAYRFDNVLRGPYTIEPVLEGYTFTPVTYGLDMTDADSLANNFTAVPGEAPDIAISKVIHPAAFSASNRIPFRITFTNRAAESGKPATWARSFGSALYFSKDRTFDASDLRIQIINVAMGSAKAKTVNAAIRGSKAKKGVRYYPIVVADHNGRVLETNESNNIRAGTRIVRRR